MSPYVNEGKQARILAAIRNGCVTCSDVEVELGFTMSKHLIAGHLSNLLRQGRIKKTGEVRVPVEHRIFGGGIHERSVRAYLYGYVEAGS